MSPLERALAALDAGEDAPALAALVEAWRDRRSPELAELVELLDSRQPKRAFARVLTPQVKPTIERLRLVADTDDPRLASFLLDALANPPFTSVSSRPFWQLVFDLALAQRDPRFRQRAAELRKAATRLFASAPLRAHVLQGISRLESQHVLVADATEEERALELELAKRLDKVRTARRREHELLAEIYADPTADGPRLVYADVLLERGDPRGELITLQFERHARGLDEAKAGRERELLVRHARRWLGPLGPIVALDESRFERGFLTIAAIVETAGKQLPLTWNAAEWATVEELRGAFQREILRHARLYALRRLRHLAVADVAALATQPALPFLEELEVETGGLDDRGRDVLGRCDGVAALRTLRIVTSLSERVALRDASWILGAPVADRLARLELAVRMGGPPVSPHVEPMAGLPDWFRRFVDDASALPATIPMLVLVPPPELAHVAPIELHRDDAGVFQRVR